VETPEPPREGNAARFGSINDIGFSVFEYGAWLGLVFAILLILLAALLLARLWRPRP
jgi:hypothetical protein